MPVEDLNIFKRELREEQHFRKELQEDQTTMLSKILKEEMTVLRQQIIEQNQKLKI